MTPKLAGVSQPLVIWTRSSGRPGCRPVSARGRVIPGKPARRRPGPVLALSLPVLSGVGHDAVVGAAGAGAAGAGAVAAEHLGGAPTVASHQVPLGPAAVQPGVAEVVPEPVRERVHAALLAAAGGHLVDPGGGQQIGSPS